MRWEELTVPEFARAVETAGRTAVIPIGVMEPHATHLPLGIDFFTPHWTACRAAEQEPVLVYPPYEWGINNDAAHLPGAVVIKRDLAFALLEALCDEMGRNGIRKIILLNGHGGNHDFVRLFVKSAVERRRPYVVYWANIAHWPGWEEIAETDECGHACEIETSTALYMFPERVRMDDIPAQPGRSRGLHKELSEAGVVSFYDWYGRYDAAYVGDAHAATAEKGRVIMERHVEDVVRVIRAVKADETVAGLQAEYYARCDDPKPPKNA